MKCLEYYEKICERYESDFSMKCDEDIRWKKFKFLRGQKF